MEGFFGLLKREFWHGRDWSGWAPARFIEELGTYNPMTSEDAVKIDAERAQAWIKNGAQPTDTVRGLLKKAGVL